MTRIVALALVAMLAGVGCERTDSAPKLRVDPVVLKAARDKAAREAAAREAVAEARAKPRPPPSEAELRRELIAEREQKCERMGREEVDETSSMFLAALAESQRKLRGRQGQEPDRQRLKRSIGLIPAAARGDMVELRRLISQGADANFDLADGDDTLSPLAWAARCDEVEAVHLLIGAGARVNKPLSWAWGRARYTNSSALIWASRTGAERAVEALLRRGARPMREVVHSDDGDKPGESPADAAATPALKQRLTRPARP